MNTRTGRRWTHWALGDRWGSACKTVGIENVTFAWAGGTSYGDVSYFRVQGPSFLVEFDHTARDPNHIHSGWRDFDGDFGRDVLREHLAMTDH